MKKELKSHKWNFFYIIETMWPQPGLKSPQNKAFIYICIFIQQTENAYYLCGRFYDVLHLSIQKQTNSAFQNHLGQTGEVRFSLDALGRYV